MGVLNKIKRFIINIMLFIALLFTGFIMANTFETNDKISLTEHEKVKTQYEENVKELKNKEEEIKKLDPKKDELQKEIDKLILEIEAAEK